MLTEQVPESWTPTSELDKAAVLKQLDTLLATPLFNSSKRYPSFLKLVVSRTLAGQTDQLKERILGVEIFGRPADYDTNTDPIVRVTAAEIRKRIEQYYQGPKHDHEIRLFLPVGSYAPQFSWRSRPASLATAGTELPILPMATPKESPTPYGPGQTRINRKPFSRGTNLAFTIPLLAVLAASVMAWQTYRTSMLKQFWQPFVNSPEAALFCIADQSQYSSIRLRDAADPQRYITLNDSMVTIIIDDVSPLVNVAGLLRSYGKTYRVLGEANTTLTDLRRGPSMFIGAFDNGWTLRLTAPLRFHFANDAQMNELWIEDRENPGKRDWLLDRSVQRQTGTYKDYAIVARLVDPNTDQYVVVAAGIGRGGTVAAGEFLVDEPRMKDMLKLLPRDWKRKNLELVLETQVIEGRSGPPRVTAVHIW